MFKSYVYPTERVNFIRNYQSSFSFVPFPQRTYFKALGDYLTIINPVDFEDSKFLDWGSKNIKGFSIEELYELCNVDKNNDVFTELSSPSEAAYYFDTALTRSYLLNIYQKAKDIVEAALTNSLRNDAKEARDDTKKVVAELSAINVALDPKVVTLTSPDIASVAKESITKQVDPKQANSVFVDTGYPLINSKIYGYHRGGTTILAAHSGVGKTWFGVDAARRVLESKGRVLFFSSEMDVSQISDRFVQNAMQKTIEDFRYNYSQNMAAFALQENNQVMNGLNLNSFNELFEKADSFFNTNGFLTLKGSKLGGMSIEQIEDDIACTSQDGQLDLVVVDYLQNIVNEQIEKKRNVPTYERVKNTMERLTRAAYEYNCPILILAQLNNPNRKQGNNPAPNLFDIADSTAVVRDAAAVIAMYKMSLDNSDNSDASQQSLDLRLSILKSRFGNLTETPFSVNRSAGSRFNLAV